MPAARLLAGGRTLAPLVSALDGGGESGGWNHLLGGGVGGLLVLRLLVDLLNSFTPSVLSTVFRNEVQEGLGPVTP